MATALSAATVQEIIRKAQSGIPLTNPTPEKLKIYNQYTSSGKTSSGTTTTTTANKTTASPSSSTIGMSASTASAASRNVITPQYNEPAQTNYGGKGNPYNEILYSKKLYDQGVLNQNQATKDYAAKRAQQYYSMLSADEAAKIKAMNTQELINYLSNKNPMPASTAVEQPQPEQQTMTPEQWLAMLQQLQQQQLDYFRSIAEGEYARELAERQRIAAQQKAALQQAYERANQIAKDTRVLEDLKFARNNSPFSGRTNYAAGLLARERQLADEAAQQNLLSALAGIDQGLADFQNTAAQAVLRRAYELQQDAKRYGLDYANLFGNLPPELAAFFPGGGPQTLAAQAQAFNNLMAYADRFGTLPGGGPQTLEAQRFNRDIYESDREYAYRLARDKIMDERYKQEFDEDVRRFNLEYALNKAVQNRQLSQADARIALERAQLAQRQREFAADQDWRAKQYELDLARLNQSRQPEPRTAEEVRTYLDSMVQRDPSTGQITNTRQLEEAILLSGLSDYETYRLYQRYGIPWNGPIPTP